MRQPLRIGTAAVLEALLAWLLGPPLAWPLLYVAAVTGTVAIAVALGATGLLGKSDQGRIPAWSLVLFAPWHVGTQVMARVHRRTHPPVITEVLPGWYVGGWPMPGDVPEGTAILDITCELWRRVDGPYLCVPAWDGTAPDLAGFERAIAWLVAQREQGPVLVHCAHGRGRSVATLIAALVETGQYTSWEEAFAFVRTKRLVRLSRVQRGLLVRWETARNARSMAVSA